MIPLPFLVLAALSSFSASISPDVPDGLWIGSFTSSAGARSLLLEFEPDESRARFERFEEGRSGVFDIEPDGERFRLLHEGTNGERIELSLGRQNGNLEGSFRAGGISGTVALRPFIVPATASMRLWDGDYVLENGDRVRIGRTSVADRETLTLYDPNRGRELTLFAQSSSDYAGIASLDKPLDTLAHVSFEGDPGDTITLSLSVGEGEEILGEKIPHTIDESAVREIVERAIAEHDVPGYGIAIVHRDEVLFQGGFGVMNRETREPVTEDTLFQIASITKTFTGLLLGLSRDNDVLRTEDPLHSYLPEETPLPPARSRGAREITLEHLVTHTAGLPLQPINYVIESRNVRTYTIAELYEGLESTVLIHPIGRHYAYSNLGYILLGHALALANDASYEALLREYVFSPLGMANSMITLTDEARGRLATPYWEDEPRRERPPWDPGDIAAHGGITSSVRDMARYLSLQFRAGDHDLDIVDGATLEESHRPRRQRSGSDSWMGWGWFIDDTDNHGRVISHTGFNGGHSSALMFSPGLEIGVVVLVNFGFRAATAVGDQLFDLAIASIREQSTPTPSQASSFSRQVDWSNAAWAYGKLVVDQPRNGAWHFALAEACLQRHLVGMAVQHAREAARLGYRPAMTWSAVARGCAMMGDVDGVLQALEKAVGAGLRDFGGLERSAAFQGVLGDARYRQLRARVDG